MHKGDIYLKLVGLSFAVEQTLFFIELAHVVNINNVRFTMRFMRIKEVMACTGLGRSSIYKFMAQGHFPQSISLGERAVAWEFSEIEEWISIKVEARNNIDKGELKESIKRSVTETDVINFINDKFNNSNVSDVIAWVIGLFKH